MELDDLKKNWQEASGKIAVPQKDLRQLLQSRSEQPLAKLRRRFRKGILLMPVIGAFIIIEFSHKKDFASHFLTWFLLCFCGIMMVYFYVNYRLVSKMQSGESDVHTNLIRQTKTLSRLLRIRLFLMRGAFVLFFLLLEALMYFRNGEGYESWKAHNFLFRLAVYIILFTGFYFFTRFAINRRYRRTIEHLQRMIRELEEE